MKKWATAIAVTVMLTGCAQQTAEDLYVQQIQEIGDLEGAPVEEIKKLGNNVCALYDEGAETPDAIKVLTDNGLEAGDAGKVLALSINQYCPEHLKDSGF